MIPINFSFRSYQISDTPKATGDPLRLEPRYNNFIFTLSPQYFQGMPFIRVNSNQCNQKHEDFSRIFNDTICW